MHVTDRQKSHVSMDEDNTLYKIGPNIFLLYEASLICSEKFHSKGEIRMGTVESKCDYRINENKQLTDKQMDRKTKQNKLV